MLNCNQEPSPEFVSSSQLTNKLDNGETCQGLLRHFVRKNKNNNEILEVGFNKLTDFQ